MYLHTYIPTVRSSGMLFLHVVVTSLWTVNLGPVMALVSEVFKPSLMDGRGRWETPECLFFGERVINYQIHAKQKWFPLLWRMYLLRAARSLLCSLRHWQHATVTVNANTLSFYNSRIPFFSPKSITKGGCNLHCEYIAVSWRNHLLLEEPEYYPSRRCYNL